MFSGHPGSMHHRSGLHRVERASGYQINSLAECHGSEAACALREMRRGAAEIRVGCTKCIDPIDKRTRIRRSQSNLSIQRAFIQHGKLQFDPMHRVPVQNKIDAYHHIIQNDKYIFMCLMNKQIPKMQINFFFYLIEGFWFSMYKLDISINIFRAKP